jgi:hypothetical protein
MTLGNKRRLRCGIRCADSFGKARQHSTDFDDLVRELIAALGREGVDISSEQEMVKSFRRGAERDLQVAVEFGVARLARAFGDICRDGERRATELRAQGYAVTIS